MERVIDNNRFHYYRTEPYRNGASLLIGAQASSAEYDPALIPTDYDGTPIGFAIEITDEDKQQLMRFFETCMGRADTDAVISGIVEEELSAYRAGVRSLEDASRMIQSRVQIYLYE